MKDERRTREELKEHYEIEKELANKLRNASRDERRILYTSVYNELFQRVPLHPQLTQKTHPERAARIVSKQMSFLDGFLNKGIIFLEIGAGDCALSIELTRYAKQVIAIDVSDEIVKGLVFPSNLKLILSDGCNIPVPADSIDVAYSNQLMEHLHPDDAIEQLENIHRALTPGGIYVCNTPNRLSGPHDISKYFDAEATGFHLKEYTVTELNQLFKRVGFTKVRAYVGARGMYMAVPMWLMTMLEKLLAGLPRRVRMLVAGRMPLRLLLGGVIVGTK